MGTIEYYCEFGSLHKTGKCRCTSTHVERRQMGCDTPELHNTKSLTVTPLYGRLHTVLDNNLGDIVLPIVIDALTEALEGEVKAWLLDSGASLRAGE